MQYLMAMCNGVTNVPYKHTHLFTHALKHTHAHIHTHTCTHPPLPYHEVHHKILCTLNIVWSGFLMGIQFSIGSGTFGIMGFLIGTPATPRPPIGGRGGTGGAPVIVTKHINHDY